MTVPAARGHGGAISASHRKLTSVANVKLVAMGQKETNSAPISELTVALMSTCSGRVEPL